MVILVELIPLCVQVFPITTGKKSYIAHGETFKMTCDDEDKIEKFKKNFLIHKKGKMVRFNTSTQKSEAVTCSHHNPKDVTHS